VSNFVQAMAYVWGADGTDRTPLFARLGKEVLWPLYEKKMTLLETEFLIDRVNKRVRGELTEGLSKRSVAQGWEFSNKLSSRDFDAQFSSTVNRFYNFLDTEKLRLMFGQSGASLDLGKAIEGGQIIIANLSTEGARVSEEDAALFATLLLSDLWTAAKERGKGTEEGDMKPFYVYIDEFQNFITPTIATNLDQSRGFGLHLTLANQFPRQILHAGANGAQVYDSVMANARSKVVFSLEGKENLEPLAYSLFMGVMNPDEIKLKLNSRKVMDYVEETRTIHSESENWSEGVGEFTGTTDTESAGGAFSLGMLARFEPVLRERGAAAWRELFWESGMIGQALYLAAEAAGVRGTGIGCYFDDVLHRALGLTGHEWQSLYHFTIGNPVEDLRLRTAPPYAHLEMGDGG